MFDWDQSNIDHIARHRVLSQEVEQVLSNDPFDMSYEFVHGEERWTSIGHTNMLRVLRIIWTMRVEAVRVVTAHDAPGHERRKYFRAKAIHS